LDTNLYFVPDVKLHVALSQAKSGQRTDVSKHLKRLEKIFPKRERA
jgi:hypothetical protein